MLDSRLPINVPCCAILRAGGFIPPACYLEAMMIKKYVVLCAPFFAACLLSAQSVFILETLKVDFPLEKDFFASTATFRAHTPVTFEKAFSKKGGFERASQDQ
ncbi:MAG: hypothetical protein ACI9TH_002110 [Kiritimatiellia bacterium]